jgi:hypothetical protein
LLCSRVEFEHFYSQSNLIIIMIDIVGATTRRFSKMSTQDNGIATITGASSGLGRIYADRFATRGYNLILIARRKERLDALAQELHKKYGVNVDVVVADFGQRSRPRSMRTPGVARIPAVTSSTKKVTAATTHA